jgi:hypothetical protein
VPIPPSFIDADFVGRELRIVASDVGRRSGDSAAVAMYVSDRGARRARRLFELGVQHRAYAISDLVPVKPPFEASPRFAIRSHGGVLYSSGATFEISTFDSAGRQTGRSSFDVPRRRVTVEDLDHWLKRSVRGLPSYMQAAIRGGSSRPAPYHPAITHIIEVGAHIWVRESARGDSVRWNVLDADGTPVGWLTLGELALPAGGHGDSILVNDPSETRGVGSLRWYRITHQ